MGILKEDSENSDLWNACFSVIAATTTNTEILKESFVNLNVDQFIVKASTSHNQGSISSLYDAIGIKPSSDDNRVAASQVYGYARRYAKVGIAEAFVESLLGGLTSPSLISASVALKAVVVNDDICRSVADKDGIEAILRCIDDSVNKATNL